MKVQRYLYGGTNVGQLQSGRSALRSPEEVAAEAAAPYQAGAEAAGAISQDLFKIAEVKIKEQEANDKALAASDVANVRTDLKLIRAKAKQEKWTDEKFSAAVEERVGAFASDIEKYSPRNRDKTAFIFGNEAKNLLAESQIEAFDIRTERTKETWAATFDRLGAVGDYEAQLSMLEIADAEGGTHLFTDEQTQIMRRNVEGRITADSMMIGYRKAVEDGKEDEFFATLDSEEISDEAWKAFGEEQTKYDFTTAEVENEIRIARQVDYAKTLQSIDATTPETAIDSYIQANKHLSDGEINSLYAALSTAKEDEAEFTGMFADTTSKKRRDAASRMLNMDKPVEEVLVDAIALTGQIKTSPSVLTNMADNYSDSTAIGDLSTIGDALLTYYGDPATAGVPLKMRDKTRAKTTMYMSLVRSNIQPATAEATVNERFDNQTEDKIDARKAAWESENFGTDGTPQEYVTEQITERLSDPDTEIGRLFVADLGEGWFNLMDKYGDIKLSSQMEYELQENARNMWLATESEEVAITAPLHAIRARGAAATDINFDVAVSTKQLEDGDGNEFEIQINPITKSGNNGEILNRNEVRAAIGQAIAGRKLKAQFTPDDAKEYSMDVIEIGDGYKATYGPNKGKMQWPLKTMGGNLTYPKGTVDADGNSIMGQPVVFWWPDTQTSEEPPIEKAAATVVNEQIEESKPAVKKAKQRDRMDFSNTGEASF